MIDILLYILDYGTVRSAVGMSADELPDEELKLSSYASTLELELDGLTLPDAANNPIKTVFKTLDPDTDSTVYNLTHLFSVYTVALEACQSLSMKAPKSLSDSKASYGRFSSEKTFLLTLQNIKARLGKLKFELEGTTSEALPLMTAVSPSVDPVTGT